MTIQLTLPQGASFTGAEIELLQAAGKRQGWQDGVQITRKSDREFDLRIEGNCTALTDRPHAFSAWLPLSVLNIAYYDRKLNRYVDDMGTGDWSFVRDADVDYIWQMFNNVFPRLK